jgi:hypothetical protein
MIQNGRLAEKAIDLANSLSKNIDDTVNTFNAPEHAAADPYTSLLRALTTCSHLGSHFFIIIKGQPPVYPTDIRREAAGSPQHRRQTDHELR